MKELAYLLKKIYKRDYQKIVTEIEPLLPKEPYREKKKDWYKSLNLYMTYPDSFCNRRKCTLNELAERIPYLKKLGINALHILPFLDSPMIDAGFDISDYQNVRDDIGGNRALRKVLTKSRKAGISIFMDLIYNHVSIEHTWFKKAVAGDPKYRNFFEHKKKKPVYIKTFKDEAGVWARYRFNRKYIDIKIIFPEFVTEIPHFIQGKDGYWYYHTFYPHQIDLNWKNPAVFIEFAMILIFWAKKGMSFRLDAITFLGKDVNSGRVESNGMLHAIIKALHYIVQRVNRDSIFLVETCQSTETIKKYFGTKQEVEAELAYSFSIMNELWKTIILKNTSDLLPALKKHYEKIQSWASWVHFLRNHDELNLEYATSHDRKKLYNLLIKQGMTFREGFGVSGRAFSFLKNHIQKHIYLYTLLASLPGIAQIPYGDEIGKTNDKKHMHKFTLLKRKRMKDQSIQHDTRDINRGIITQKDLNQRTSKRIYKQFSTIFSTRKKYSSFFKTVPKLCNENIHIFHAVYTYKNRHLYVYVNVSTKKQVIEMQEDGSTVMKIGIVTKSNSKIELKKISGIWILSK